MNGIEGMIKEYLEDCQNDYNCWVMEEMDIDWNDLMENFAHLWYWIDMEEAVNSKLVTYEFSWKVHED